MPPVHIAVVSRDPATRLAAAAAFDGAPATWRVELHDAVPSGADVVVVGPDVPAEGVVFDPARPGTVVEDVRCALRGDGRLSILVTSPSGGTGVTTLALHLAHDLAARGETCLIDCDPRGGVGARLGLAAGARTWDGVDSTESSLRKCAVPVPGGFRVLLPPVEAVGGATRRDEVLDRARGAFERIVLDAPEHKDVGDLSGRVSAAVLVVAPTTPGAGRARRLLESFPDVSWAIVTNRLGPGGETTRPELESVLGHSIALELPCAPALRDAEDHGRLLTSTLCRWRRAVHRLARALES